MERASKKKRRRLQKQKPSWTRKKLRSKSNYQKIKTQKIQVTIKRVIIRRKMMQVKIERKVVKN